MAFKSQEFWVGCSQLNTSLTISYLIIFTLCSQEGYVDGLTEGQDLLLQQGFNEGYRQAAQLSAAIARIKGSVW